MVITSTSNPTIRSVRQLHARKGRRAAGRTLVEGPNGLEALDRHGLAAELVICTDGDDDAIAYAASIGVEPTIVAEHVLAAASDTDHPVGPVAVIPIPAPRSIRPTNTVVLVGVADPGNVGSIIRTAAALGWDVAVAGTTADVWSPKALRSSAGATLGVRPSRVDDLADALEAVGLTSVALVVGDTSPIASMSVEGPIGLLVGSEAHGLPMEVVKQAKHCVTIPMHRGVESLNAAAAAAIAMHVLG